MKKLFAITLILIMALCLMAGCGKKSPVAYYPLPDNNGQQVATSPNIEGVMPDLETFPQVTAPQFTMPELDIDVPDVEVPDVEVPTTAPPQTESIPLPTLPVYDEPDYDEPVYTTPDVEDVAPEPNYYLNDNNNTYNENGVSVNPRYVYWDGENLIAEVFVVNGYNYTVTGIMLDHFELSVNGQLIAAADFGQLPDVNISPYCYQLYTLTFGKDAISYPGADLYDLDWYYELRSRG